MGVDYIREQSGKPWRKRWNGGLDRLKMPSMFDAAVTEACRTVTAELDAGCSMQCGEPIVVQVVSDRAVISRGQVRVGSISKLPGDVGAIVSNNGGIALGTIERMGIFGTTVEIRLSD